MRTRKEMMQYNKNHRFGNRWFTKKSFKLIERTLYAGEEALVAFSGTLDHKRVWRIRSRYAFALTSNRLIFAQKKFFSFKTDTKSIELSAIRSINFNKEVIRCNLIFNTINLTFSLRKFRKRGKRVYKAVNAALGALRGFSDDKVIDDNSKVDISSLQKTNSVADEILKFSTLLEQNIINQEEFDKIKGKLLSQMNIKTEE
ncbi:MAG: PH domain-containing protein [Firmicutes bacterium]|nr:PH domain-containing protein [Bacillota bacterium]